MHYHVCAQMIWIPENFQIVLQPPRLANKQIEVVISFIVIVFLMLDANRNKAMAG